MSTPTMRGSKGSVFYVETRIDNTSDSTAINFGVVEPGGSVTILHTNWANFGYAYLYNPQISFVVNPTVDIGADADTIERMIFDKSGGSGGLGYMTPATPSNTTTWAEAMPSIFRPFLDIWRVILRWYPPVGATTGVIRKAIQWDGSYYPDTWDYVWYPMSNGYFPDNAFYDNPLVVSGSNYTTSVEVDASCHTGYRLNNEWDGVGGPSVWFKYEHSLAGTPWYDGVNNATGYVIEYSFDNMATIASGGIKFIITDGARKWEVHISTTSIDSISGFAVPFSVVWNSAVYFNTYQFCVIGDSFELFVNGGSKATGTLNVADANKTLSLNSYYTGMGIFAGEIWTNYLKYFLNGNTPPVH